jgi:hypothetical protein
MSKIFASYLTNYFYGIRFWSSNINKMPDLALVDDENGRFLIIMNCTDEASKQQKQTEISRVLGTGMQLVVRMGTA